MIKSIKCLLWLFVISNLSLLSCGDDNNIDSQKTFKDDSGNLFYIDSIPKRIVSLAPNLTEIMYAIGADSLLVGVTDFCDYPPQAQTKTKVGGILDPNFEIISSLKPDVVLLTTEGNPKNIYFSLINYNFKVFITNPLDINGVSKTILKLGTLTGKEEKAKILSSYMLDKKKEYELINKGKVRKKCLLLISNSPFITVNKFTYINEIIELSGLENIYQNEINSYPQVNPESIIRNNPDYIIFSIDTNNVSRKNECTEIVRKEFNTTDAVKNNKIIFIDENILMRPGPRIMDCIRYIKNNL